MPGKCKFQESWLSKDIYKGWLVKDARDIHFARCKACCKSIKLQTMGEAALTSHAGGAGHKAAVRKLMEGSLTITAAPQMNGSTNQAEDSKDQVAVCLHQSLDRVTESDLSEMQHSPNTNSNSHNAELHDVALPAAFFTAPGTSRLNPRHIPSGGATKDAGHHDTAALSQLEYQQRTEALEQQQQMKILEWENRMKVLAWEQELVGDKRRAARQKEKAFRMKKAYYKAKLRKLGEDVPPSSSSDEDEKTSAATG